ncbi:MAG: BrnT family toxin [Phycisphaerae bacterium]|nr:BrnT family toxin [Phycisphaerae bacterium]
MAILFEWDRKKAENNFKKHRVSFVEATSIFKSPLSMTIYDPDHSREEDRFITVGMSGHKLLVVVHCDRGNAIRIISAREATRRERKQYEETR